MKNCEPRSEAVMGEESIIVREEIPARTRFFAISEPRARRVMRRMFAERIFSWACTPQRRIWRS